MAENQRGGNQGNQGGNRGSSQEGGKSQRGLASASKETRERVAREGGKASHGGGRTSGSGNSGGSSSNSGTGGRER